MQKGIIDLSTIIIISLIILAIGLSLLSGGFLQNLIGVTSVKSQEAFYLSDSGTQDALIKVARNKNFTNTGYSPNITDSGETLNIVVSGSDTKTIQSSSDIQNRNRNIQMNISLNSDGQITSYSWQETTQ